MPLVAKAPEGSYVYTEGQAFDFKDGTRQVTNAEADALRRYKANGGTVHIDIEETKSKKGSK